MHRYSIQGPRVIWKAFAENSLSTRMEMLRAIVTEPKELEIDWTPPPGEIEKS
jgi:hypothetical protein